MTSRLQPDQPHDWSALAERLRRCASALAGRGRGDLADDLVQDTVARLLSRGGDPPSYAYARAALVRLYLDHHRGAARRAARALRWAASVQRRSPETSAGVDGGALERALDRLSPLQRAALTLRLVEDLPTGAVAEALGASERVVRASLHTARVKMRAILSEGGEP